MCMCTKSGFATGGTQNNKQMDLALWNAVNKTNHSTPSNAKATNFPYALTHLEHL